VRCRHIPWCRPGLDGDDDIGRLAPYRATLYDDPSSGHGTLGGDPFGARHRGYPGSYDTQDLGWGLPFHQGHARASSAMAPDVAGVEAGTGTYDATARRPMPACGTTAARRVQDIGAWGRGRARVIFGLAGWRDTIVPARAVGQYARRREVMGLHWRLHRGAGAGGASSDRDTRGPSRTPTGLRRGTSHPMQVRACPCRTPMKKTTPYQPRTTAPAPDDPSRVSAGVCGYDNGYPSPRARSCRTWRATRRMSPRSTAARTDTRARCTFSSAVCLWPILTLL
jgi:hypothetical protein